MGTKTMSDLISRCELFNRLASVQTMGDAYAVIQGMPTVERFPDNIRRAILNVLDNYADEVTEVERGAYERARYAMCKLMEG